MILNDFSAWLYPTIPIVRQIALKTNLITNLDNINYSNDWQVNVVRNMKHDFNFISIGNYGIGGHYDPHFDFARVCEFILD